MIAQGGVEPSILGTRGGRRVRCFTSMLVLCLVACDEPGAPYIGQQALRMAAPDQTQPFRAVLPLAEEAEEDVSYTIPPAPGGSAPLRDHGQSSGVVTVSCDATALRLVVEPLRAALARDLPDLTFEFTASNARNAAALVLRGSSEGALVADLLLPDEHRHGLQQWPVGDHVLALVLHAGVRLEDLPSGHVRLLFTGQTNHWSWLGSDAGHVTLLLPPVGPDLDLLAELFASGSRLTDQAVRTRSDLEVIDLLLRTEGAVGIVSLPALERTRDTRVVSIDGVKPDALSFRTSAYPFGRTVHLFTPGPPKGNLLALREYLASPLARKILANHLVLR